MFKIIILDFDGVVVESTDIKTRAFRELFKCYPKHVEAIVDYHKRHGGVSRFKKLAYIYKNILKQPIDEKTLDELGKKFSALVFDEIKKCPLVPGALEFLEEYSKKANLFVASGTPEQELQDIIKGRGLSKYFRGAYGAPAAKSEIIRKIMKEENVNSGDVLFIGDSINDYEGAAIAGVTFIARLSDPSASNPLLKHGINHVNDLKEVRNLLESGRLWNP